MMERAAQLMHVPRDKNWKEMAPVVIALPMREPRAREGEDVVQTHASRDKSFWKMGHVKHVQLTNTLQVPEKIV